MILLSPLALYLLLVMVLLFLANALSKHKDNAFRKKLKRWIIGLSTLLLFVLGFFYFSFLFGLALEDHSDVQEGTFLWHATMDNKTITQFPVLEPNGKHRYNSIGGDGPNISTGWEITYVSQLNRATLTPLIIHYLKTEGFVLKEVQETQYYWIGRYKKKETNQLYSGSNEKGESVDLLLEQDKGAGTKVVCTIVF